MYSLVSTCIRPKVYDEDEIMIVPPSNSTNSNRSEQQGETGNNINNAVIDNSKQRRPRGPRFWRKSSSTPPRTGCSNGIHSDGTKNGKEQGSFTNGNGNDTIRNTKTPHLPPSKQTNITNASSPSMIQSISKTSQTSSCIPHIEVLHEPEESLIDCIKIHSPSAKYTQPKPITSVTFCDEDDGDNNDNYPSDDGAGGGDSLLMTFKKKDVPLFYSPLCDIDNIDITNNGDSKESKKFLGVMRKSSTHSSTLLSKKSKSNHDNETKSIQQQQNKHKRPIKPLNNKRMSIIPPAPTEMKNHSQRWKYQSSLAGAHSQCSHILDISHKPNISLQSLKYGITPNMANDITDFRFCSEESTMDLPSVLDLITTLFPNLEHLTMLEDKTIEDDGEIGAHYVDKSSSGSSSSSTCNMMYTPMSDNKQQQYSFKEDNINDACVKVYSADGDDADLRSTFEVATASCQKIPCTIESLSLSSNYMHIMSHKTLPLPPLSSITKKAIDMAEKESERMKRLYIVYRLPALISIDGKDVTEDERTLARPLTPSGLKVNRREWLTQAMAAQDYDKNAGSTNTTKVNNNVQEHNNDLYMSSEEEDSREMEGEGTPPSSPVKDGTGTELSSQQQQQQQQQQIFSSPQKSKRLTPQQMRASVASPSRSNLIGIFPHTGKSVSMSTPPTSKAVSLSPSSKLSGYEDNLKHNATNNLSPSKNNLDTFIAKDKANLKLKSRPLPPPSEASDIAVAGHLLSKCNLDPSFTIAEKENTANANFPSQSGQSMYANEDKEELKRKACSKRRERKERRSLPLVGSMVKVKLKKGKRSSLPPTSPASKIREYPSPRSKIRRPPLASVLDQEFDEDDDSEEEIHVNDN